MIFRLYEYLNSTNVFWIAAVIFYVLGFAAIEVECWIVARNRDMIYLEDHFWRPMFLVYDDERFKWLALNGYLDTYKKSHPQIPENDTNIASLAGRVISGNHCKFGIALKVISVILYLISGLIPS